MKVLAGLLLIAALGFTIYILILYVLELFKKIKRKSAPTAETVDTEKEMSEPATTDSDIKKCAYFENRACDLADENGDCTTGKESCEKDF